MAERVGFEPTCRFPDKTLSRRPRYDHFGTSPENDQLRSSSVPFASGYSTVAALTEETLHELSALIAEDPLHDLHPVVE